VGGDAGYGKEPKFLRALDADGETFVVDVHCSQVIYPDNPLPLVPRQRTGKRGRAPTRLVPQCTGTRVDTWVKRQGPDQWRRIALRESTKGTLMVDILRRRVWVWDKEEPKAHCWHLIARREIGNSKEIKYSLSNAPEREPTERLAQMQGQRYWIEHAFRNAKSEVGMDEYQARQWQSWHHHMAMVCLAMLFMLETRVEYREQIPLLSCYDILEILKATLPRKGVTYDEMIEQVQERHRRRLASIESAKRKQMREGQHSGP
jgi:SRSO17 transposase